MISPPNSNASQPSALAPEFGTSADGFPVARVGDTLLALISNGDGSFFLASAWRIFEPLEDLRRDRFHGHGGRTENEGTFRARVIETARHVNELLALARVEASIVASTPWGCSQCATIHADGVIRHSTASHGGFHLSSDRNSCVDASVRRAGGWYEEDAEWALVAATFPALFTAHERRCADETIRNSWPDYWEELHGRTLRPGESWSRDRAEFDRTHADDWVVISAIHSSHEPAMTEVIATLGGGRGQERRFLVPHAEYAARNRFGFVIDLDRHTAYDGPSSFVC